MCFKNSSLIYFLTWHLVVNHSCRLLHSTCILYKIKHSENHRLWSPRHLALALWIYILFIYPKLSKSGKKCADIYTLMYSLLSKVDHIQTLRHNHLVYHRSVDMKMFFFSWNHTLSRMVPPADMVLSQNVINWPQVGMYRQVSNMICTHSVKPLI